MVRTDPRYADVKYYEDYDFDKTFLRGSVFPNVQFLVSHSGQDLKFQKHKTDSSFQKRELRLLIKKITACFRKTIDGFETYRFQLKSLVNRESLVVVDF